MVHYLKTGFLTHRLNLTDDLADKAFLNAAPVSDWYPEQR